MGLGCHQIGDMSNRPFGSPKTCIHGAQVELCHAQIHPCTDCVDSRQVTLYALHAGSELQTQGTGEVHKVSSMSRMHNPAHPGEVLREYLPEELTVAAAAEHLGVSRQTLSALLNGRSGVSADMALRLSQALGTSADMWLNMQVAYDLWQARQSPPPKIKRIAA